MRPTGGPTFVDHWYNADTQSDLLHLSKQATAGVGAVNQMSTDNDPYVPSEW